MVKTRSDDMDAFNEKVNFIWSIADILRGTYRKENYSKVILPMCMIRRFDCALKETKEDVLKKYEEIKHFPEVVRDEILSSISGHLCSNISKFNFENLLYDSDNIAENLNDYINGFSKTAREIFEHFNFNKEIYELDKNNLLYLVVKKFNELNLHPEYVSNIEMGHIYEELIRRFSEGTESGDHYTPREVIKLMVNLLFSGDEEELKKQNASISLYDCCAGTGGMGSIAEDYIRGRNESLKVEFYAQEINNESYAICKLDSLIKGDDPEKIKFGNTLSQDAYKEDKFDYMISNPPYGVDWKSVEDVIKKECFDMGFKGRFGAGMPRISDGQLLFIQHLVSKMKPVSKDSKGSRIAILMNGSPLFTGGAGSGESDIRKWLLENDLVEGIVAIPSELFYNTAIATYIWILSNNKSEMRKGKVQLVNAVDFCCRLRKSIGNKRNKITSSHIDTITSIYEGFEDGPHSKIMKNEEFGFTRLVIENPLRLNFKVDDERIERLYEQNAFNNLVKTSKYGQAGYWEAEVGRAYQEKIISLLREIDSNIVFKNRKEFSNELKRIFHDNQLDITSTLFKVILTALSERDETADICVDSRGNIEVDIELRQIEDIPLGQDIQEYIEKEVSPYFKDFWIDDSKTKIGYEIPITQYFYKHSPLRSSDEIVQDIRKTEKSILKTLKKVMKE